MRIKSYQKHMLYSIFSMTILLRFIHKYDWPIWGSDSGEYLYLTSYLVENGMMLNENYIGWGITSLITQTLYQYFYKTKEFIFSINLFIAQFLFFLGFNFLA